MRADFGPKPIVRPYTGLRWGELAALTVGAVDLKRRRLQINGSFAEVGGRVRWKAPKDHERRSVPFPAFLLSDLSEALAGKGRDDLVFHAPKGGALRISLWRPRGQHHKCFCVIGSLHWG